MWSSNVVIVICLCSVQIMIWWYDIVCSVQIAKRWYGIVCIV